MSKIKYNNTKWYQKIFSVKNSTDKRHKVFILIGIKFKIKRYAFIKILYHALEYPIRVQEECEYLEAKIEYSKQH